MDSYIEIKVTGSSVGIFDSSNNHRCYTTIEGLPDVVRYYKYIKDKKLCGDMTRMIVSNYTYVFHTSPVDFEGNYVKPDRIDYILKEIYKTFKKHISRYDRKQLENESYESLLTIYNMINASHKLAECT